MRGEMLSLDFHRSTVMKKSTAQCGAFLIWCYVFELVVGPHCWLFLQSAGEFYDHHIFPLLEVAGEDVFPRFANQPQIEGHVVE